MVEDESPPRKRERASDGGAGSPEPAQPPDAFERGKRLLLLACAAIAGGLAIAGTMDRSTGGVVLLAGWGIAVAALHRLGRAGSVRPAKTGRARSARPLRSRS
jgi:hypothetical protein